MRITRVEIQGKARKIALSIFSTENWPLCLALLDENGHMEQEWDVSLPTTFSSHLFFPDIPGVVQRFADQESAGEAILLYEQIIDQMVRQGQRALETVKCRMEIKPCRA